MCFSISGHQQMDRMDSIFYFILFFKANNNFIVKLNFTLTNPNWEILFWIEWYSYIQCCEILFQLACFHITSVKLFPVIVLFTLDSVIVGVSLFCWYGSCLMGVNCKAKSGLAAVACVSYLRIIMATSDPLNPPMLCSCGATHRKADVFPKQPLHLRWIFTLLTQSTATWPSQVKTNTAFPVPDVEGLFWIASQTAVVV